MSATATARPTPTTMSDLFNAYGEAWASHNADAIADFHAEDGIFHLHADGEAVRGREAIRDTFAGFLTQWPDLDFAEESKHVEDWGWVAYVDSATLLRQIGAAA
jgi:uncharacterized protein (TIGR02246 family)